jgi:hypothetical protein
VRPKAPAVPAELQAPIEELKRAIETGLPTRMQEVYAHFDQDPATKTYWKTIFDKADSISVKPVNYRSSNTSGNTAELRYTMDVSVMSNGSKLPTVVGATWRADLVREGPRARWKILRLTRITL